MACALSLCIMYISRMEITIPKRYRRCLRIAYKYVRVRVINLENIDAVDGKVLVNIGINGNFLLCS